MRKFTKSTDHSNYKYYGRYNHVLEFIIHYKTQNDGAGPTIREICAACWISSTSVVNYAINRLLDAGLIYVTPNGHIGVTGGAWTMTDKPDGVDPVIEAAQAAGAEIALEPESPTTIIVSAFEKHLKENHSADFEVCSNPECERAYALELKNGE